MDVDSSSIGRMVAVGFNPCLTPFHSQIGARLSLNIALQVGNHDGFRF